MTPEQEKRLEKIEERAELLDGFSCPCVEDGVGQECLSLQGGVLFDNAWLIARYREADAHLHG